MADDIFFSPAIFDGHPALLEAVTQLTENDPAILAVLAAIHRDLAKQWPQKSDQKVLKLLIQATNTAAINRSQLVILYENVCGKDATSAANIFVAYYNDDLRPADIHQMIRTAKSGLKRPNGGQATSPVATRAPSVN